LNASPVPVESDRPAPDPAWLFHEQAQGVAGERGLHHFQADADGNLHGWIDGHGGRWRIDTDLDRVATPDIRVDAGDAIVAPLPGVVSEVLVATGATVRAGQKIGSLEAMKLIHALTAPRDGQVATVAVKVGETVSQGSLLVGLERVAAG